MEWLGGLVAFRPFFRVFTCHTSLNQRRSETIKIFIALARKADGRIEFRRVSDNLLTIIVRFSHDKQLSASKANFSQKKKKKVIKSANKFSQSINRSSFYLGTLLCFLVSFASLG
jgi:uncharacterized protein YjhX (UPF0386 family)